MIDLESMEWTTAKTGPGGNGALTADLLRQFRDGDDSAFGELYQQVCHQNTVGEASHGRDCTQLVASPASAAAWNRGLHSCVDEQLSPQCRADTRQVAC
jgi:hypothetical protein